MQQAEQLDRYLPAPVRVWIEQTYYARINAQAQLVVALADPTFYRDPAAHLALFNDHGVVHVRDVAQQVLRVLDHTHGGLITWRDDERLQGFMKSYGVLAAYLHDIGMIDFRPFGRAMHPESPERVVTAEEIAAMREFVADALPALRDAPIAATRVCLYCDSRDGHFWIAHDPDRPGLVVAAGDSGHAFKFAPVLGGIVADVVEGRSHPLQARFRWRRGLRPPRWEEATRSQAS